MEIGDMWDDDEDRDSNTDAPIKSDHARLLNRLAEMQRVPYYATARCELALAEQTILQLEAENTKLNVAAKQLEKSPPGTVNLWAMLTPKAFDTSEEGE